MLKVFGPNKTVPAPVNCLYARTDAGAERSTVVPLGTSSAGKNGIRETQPQIPTRLGGSVGITPASASNPATAAEIFPPVNGIA
jgi:hypothetical protein